MHTAIEKNVHLLSIPGEMSIPSLKIYPAWELLRNHPRFKKAHRARQVTKKAVP